MTAGSHGAEEVAAEFLFVLCKESGECSNLSSNYCLSVSSEIRCCCLREVPLQYHRFSPTHICTASRLIKHTGYGNAAGLLMARGLLGGGRSEGEGEYSSNSETSDTEDSK